MSTNTTPTIGQRGMQEAPFSPAQAQLGGIPETTAVGLGKGAAYTQHRAIVLLPKQNVETIYDLVKDLSFAKSPQQLQVWSAAGQTYKLEFDHDITSDTPTFLAGVVYVLYLRFTNLHVQFIGASVALNMVGFWD